MGIIVVSSPPVIANTILIVTHGLLAMSIQGVAGNLCIAARNMVSFFIRLIQVWIKMDFVLDERPFMDFFILFRDRVTFEICSQ